MPAIRPKRSPEPDLPGRHFGTDMIAFVLFSAGVPLLAPELTRTNDDPRVFALTHVAVLGWISMTMVGALYQLFPVGHHRRVEDHGRRRGRPGQEGEDSRPARRAGEVSDRLCERENRKEEGLILLHPVVTNLAITIWRRLRRLGFLIRRRSEATAVRPIVDQLEIRARSLSQPVSTLSGGNQQKVSLGKWLAADAEILIIDEPTTGIDIKTKGALHELIWDLAAKGKAILVISSDMPEIVRIADRVLVMRNHRIVAEIANNHEYEEVSEAIMSRLS